MAEEITVAAELPIIAPKPVKKPAAPSLTHFTLAPGVPGGKLPVSQFHLKEFVVYPKTSLPTAMVERLIANGTCVAVPAPDAAE